MDHLFCAIAMATDDAPNAHGVRGLAFAAKPSAGKPDRLGCGQHGGLGAAEQAPFLMVEVTGYPAGAAGMSGSSPVDIAPTVLRHLGLPSDGCEGRKLRPEPFSDAAGCSSPSGPR